MIDHDERTEVTISKLKTGMCEKEERYVTLKSKDESIDSLIEKARKTLQDW